MENTIMMRFLFLFLFFPTMLFSQVSIDDNYEQAVIFKIVEEMPQFGDCGEVKVLARSECFQDYLCRKLRYPKFAKQHKVQGEVIVSFVIDEAGKVSDAKIIQDIGAGCGTATLNFVNGMPDWKAGKQRGKAVKVAYQLKVDYRLPDISCR